jgi:hypothetical protein
VAAERERNAAIYRCGEAGAVPRLNCSDRAIGDSVAGSYTSAVRVSPRRQIQRKREPRVSEQLFLCAVAHMRTGIRVSYIGLC